MCEGVQGILSTWPSHIGYISVLDCVCVGVDGFIELKCMALTLSESRAYMWLMCYTYGAVFWCAV